MGGKNCAAGRTGMVPRAVLFFDDGLDRCTTALEIL